jgi:hypothetical protein
VLWLGIAWTVVICIIDRLIYKSFGTGRVANLALAVPRAALSVMLALVLGLPMVQFIFRPSIDNQLSHSITGAAYEEVAAALRERDRLEAHRLTEETAVLRKRFTKEAKAEEDVDEVRIDVDRARRIAREEALGQA